MYEMPCVCPGCGVIVELNDMRRAPRGLTGTELVCPACASDQQAELDAEEVDTTDPFGDQNMS